ncbi:hypothetical protein PGT21_012072 [Puccinia graminis f. sp. tritici]|uniref:Uncharacterized protein n=1 Tax=Puccinia graminis f. sp. tritici TaxID=56615 RepID=A0A5B0MEQ1_PUCGR|nr:hypothetical protein PGT21_012072 [Puccinia graminis f. sp. tritici]
MDKLEEICPKCFGPPVPRKTPEEPDYIVCMDGNFQHRQHLAASHELSEYSNQTSLFISPEEVEDMESCMNIQINEAEEHPNLDRCTKQHTAANNSRGSTTWKACDDTGIFGLEFKRLLDRGLHVKKLLVESMNKLTKIREKHNFTIEYLTEQWIRQRQCQLEAMDTESEREMIKLVGDLVNLEDELQDAQDDIELLRAKRRGTRTVEEQERLELLPNTVTSLEEQIEILVDELGSEAFWNLPGASDAQSKALIRLKTSKSKLYKAKVGVCEVQRRWDQRGSGTRMQARFKKLMSSKMKHLKSKWTLYNQKALNYNENHSTNILVATPVFEDVRSMGLDDPFWNIGSLSHPNEPWAIDSTIKEGIEAILMSTHCNEDLRRISREARQAIKWAVEKSKCLDMISKLLHRGQLAELWFLLSE